MASKTIDEFLKTASAKDLAIVKETRQGLERNGVAVKPEYQESARRAVRPNSTEPKLDKTVFPNQGSSQEQPQRGAQKIQQVKDEAKKPKAAEAEKAPEKSAPAPTPDKGR